MQDLRNPLDPDGGRSGRSARRAGALGSRVVVALGLFVICLPAVATAETIAVPSGQPVEWLDMIRDETGPDVWIARFRFLAPEIAHEGGSIGFAEAEKDMEVLCTSFALPQVEGADPMPEQIIISLADRRIEFGASDPEATQYFDGFRPENGGCVWEGF